MDLPTSAGAISPVLVRCLSSVDDAVPRRSLDLRLLGLCLNAKKAERKY